jgi:hypothetical protein
MDAGKDSGSSVLAAPEEIRWRAVTWVLI